MHLVWKQSTLYSKAAHRISDVYVCSIWQMLHCRIQINNVRSFALFLQMCSTSLHKGSLSRPCHSYIESNSAYCIHTYIPWEPIHAHACSTFNSEPFILVSIQSPLITHSHYQEKITDRHLCFSFSSHQSAARWCPMVFDSCSYLSPESQWVSSCIWLHLHLVCPWCVHICLYVWWGVMRWRWQWQKQKSADLSCPCAALARMPNHRSADDHKDDHK